MELNNSFLWSVDLIKDVPTDNLLKIYDICSQLSVICTKEKGIGISAVQVGIPWKLFIINIENNFEYFVNCSYSPLNDEKISHLEGCLSLKNGNRFRNFEVERSKSILVNGFKLVEKNTALVLNPLIDYYVEDFMACVFQHEIDHHCGITIDKIGKEIELW